MSRPTVGVVVQARLGSTRLPRKVLLDIHGAPMLTHVIARASAATLVDRVIVATTTNPQDDALASWVSDAGHVVFRGDEHDVLDRYFQAARHHQLDVVVRVTSDCPLLDPGLLDDVVRAVLTSKTDVEFAANTLERSFPRGLDVEVVTMPALDRLWRTATEEHDRAHVFPYVYRHQDEFRVASVMNATDRSWMRWTVDTTADLEFVRAVAEGLGQMPTGWMDVVALLERRPELLALNRHIEQKALTER